jgi:hypothetical protein
MTRSTDVGMRKLLAGGIPCHIGPALLGGILFLLRFLHFTLRFCRFVLAELLPQLALFPLTFLFFFFLLILSTSSVTFADLKRYKGPQD